MGFLLDKLRLWRQRLMSEEGRKHLRWLLEIGSSIAVIVASILAYWNVKLIEATVRESAIARERPALVFLENVDVALADRNGLVVIRFLFEIKNQGSGNAYDVSWRFVEQLPPLHSDLLTREMALSSFSNCRESFQTALGTGAGKVVIGAGLSHYITVEHEVGVALHGQYEGKKYVAAFFQNESGRENASVVGVRFWIEGNKDFVNYKVEDIVICDDPRTLLSNK